MLVSEIFKKEPDQWGQRGDPYLWSDIAKKFDMSVSDISVDEFEKQLIYYFENLSGVSIRSIENVFIQGYDHGGMSGGYINPPTWRKRLIPYLVKRFKIAKGS